MRATAARHVLALLVIARGPRPRRRRVRRRPRDPDADPRQPGALVSPVTGRLTHIDAEGLTKVTAFRLRMDDGREIDFEIGVLENGAQFPPGHLAEHMANASPVRVFFRDEGGRLVVYRLEDG